MRDYSHQKSNFCNLNKALQDLEMIASQTNYKYLLLSYNNEGLMPQDTIHFIGYTIKFKIDLYPKYIGTYLK